MRRMNLIALLSPTGDQVLLCLRKKPPYQGLYNLVGGKAEPGETDEAAAYRELAEETGVTRAQTTLHPLLELVDAPRDILLSCWSGRLRAETTLREELNRLAWMRVEEDFTDAARFAGEGNVQTIVDAAREREKTCFSAGKG